jgi:hypothetical protein
MSTRYVTLRRWIEFNRSSLMLRLSPFPNAHFLFRYVSMSPVHTGWFTYNTSGIYEYICMYVHMQNMCCTASVSAHSLCTRRTQTSFVILRRRLCDTPWLSACLVSHAWLQCFISNASRQHYWQCPATGQPVSVSVSMLYSQAPDGGITGNIQRDIVMRATITHSA